MAEQHTICLIDGSGYIFRAFYALPPMTRADGTPVNAVYGFTNMLMNLINDNACEHMVVVFDAKRKNYRNDIFADYKANRRETPPDLIPQFPLIRKATEALNVSWIEMEGFEADDLIATYARLAGELGWHARVISADKDLLQLMNAHTSVFDPMKRKLMTEQDVIAKFGVAPDKVVDVQSLMGDSVDNIPGASGIGPKTAAELINTFGSLENLLAHLDEIPQQKRREGLIRDKEQILISRQLVELNKHVPVDNNLTQFQVKTPDWEILSEFLKENKFFSLLERIKANVTTVESSTPAPKKQYQLILTDNDLVQYLNQITDSISICIMTDSKNQLTDKVVGIGLSLTSGNACYIPIRHGGEEQETFDLFSTTSNRPKQLSCKIVLSQLKPILENPSILKIGHNVKYMLHIFKNEYGDNFNIKNFDDIMLMSYALDGSQHGHTQPELAQVILQQELPDISTLCGSGKNQILFNQTEPKQTSDFCCASVDIIGQIFKELHAKLEGTMLAVVYQKIDLPLVPILCKMERNGFTIDKATLSELDIYFNNEINELTKEIHSLAKEEFNINSPAQLGQILFEKMGYTGGKKGANGAFTTDVKVLESLASEQDSLIAEKVLEYRSFAKLKSTYVDAFLKLLHGKENRVHTTFSLTGTSTGRLASSDPNLQNIPIRSEAGKEIRKTFIAPKGYKILCADYSQIELRLMADVANVHLLKEAFLNDADIHTATASQVFQIPPEQIDSDTRRRAKAINFGIIYGISPFGLARQLKISRVQAKQYIDSYFERYPEIKTYMEQTIGFAKNNEYVLTPFGRKCFISGINDKRLKSFAERAAINAPIQGGAADIIKMAMIKVTEKLSQTKMDIKLLLQVHDELIFEVAEKDVIEATKLVKETMENVVKLSIPLIADVGIGGNWKEAH